MLSEEKLNFNFLTWIKKLQHYNCYSEEMINEIGDKLKLATFSTFSDTGAAYHGSMIDIVLYRLCKTACLINEFGLDKNPNLKVNTNMLMRVLLLQHISKCELFVPQENQWKIKNGYLFDYNNNLTTKLKCGERSVYMCMKYGIKLTEEEYEAMTVIDKIEDRGECFLTPLSIIVKFSNQLTMVDLRLENNKTKIKETIEE